MKVYFECLYCGNKFTEYYYSDQYIDMAKCPKCQDKHLKSYKEEDTDLFGYKKGKK